MKKKNAVGLPVRINDLSNGQRITNITDGRSYIVCNISSTSIRLVAVEGNHLSIIITADFHPEEWQIEQT